MRAEQLLRRGLLRAAQALLFEVRRRARGVRVDPFEALFEQLAHGLLEGGGAFPQVSLQGPRFAGVRLPHHGPGRPHVPLVSP